ncbi:MAG: DNA primase [Actinomyces graevenitzii]|nr:DNA primase [Actinomyces graevenitzii]
MATDPRAALNRLIAALEQHFEASSTGDEFSPAVIAAEDRLADAFFTYDDSLFTAFGIELPLDIVDADEDEDDDFDEEDFEDDEDEDYDVDDFDEDDDEDIDEEDLNEEDLDEEDEEKS